MFDYRQFADHINKVLSLLGERLPESRKSSVSSLVNVGEWELALETLCDNLYEDETPISSDIYTSIAEAGRMLNADDDLWIILSSQIE